MADRLTEAEESLHSNMIITSSYLDGVKNWPVKFPEYSYPRILLEMVGNEVEEKLLVAVSLQLKINS